MASAEASVPDLDRLREAMLEPDWVAEEAELHLLPHVRRLCDERGWTISRAEVVEAVLEIDVTFTDDVRNPTEAAFALIGTLAEPSTHVVQTKPDHGRDVAVVITTGVLAGDSAFAPHGHVVRLHVRTDAPS
jgi:hypothetical protein